jgi:hypothetical protein
MLLRDFLLIPKFISAHLSPPISLRGETADIKVSSVDAKDLFTINDSLTKPLSSFKPKMGVVMVSFPFVK